MIIKIKKQKKKNRQQQDSIILCVNTLYLAILFRPLGV